MHEWVEKLLALQDKDLRIARLEEQINAAPADKKKVDRLRTDAQSAATAAHDELQNQEKSLKTLEIEAETVRDKMRDFQSKSAFIKNNEEYRAAMSQIDGCKQQIRGIEDRELVVMEAIEEDRAAYAERRKELQAMEKRVSDMLADLDTRVKNCNAELGKLRGERKAAAAEVKADVARRYERLRQKRRQGRSDRRSFVPIRDDVCDCCHMNVIAQIRNNARKGLDASCENCGALLYWED